jgi:hypothetical protein
MKIRISWIITLSFLLQFLFTGCSQEKQFTPTKFLGQTPTLQTIIRSSATNTIEPTKIKTPSPTILYTRTSSPTQTSTSLPTLEATQVFTIFEELLHKGIDCKSSCFLGIIPGETTKEQAVAIFNQLDNPLVQDNLSGFYITSYKYNDDISIHVYLDIRDQIVKNIELMIVFPSVENTPDAIAWQGFSAHNFIDYYGTVSRVDFAISYPPEGNWDAPIPFYTMNIFFESNDLVVSYYEGSTQGGSFIRVCPSSDHYRAVMVYIGKDFYDQPFLGGSLEELTALTLTQFSDLVIGESGTDCLYLSSDAYFQNP